MAALITTPGLPNIGTARDLAPYQISMDGFLASKPGGGVINGSKSRDPGNTLETNALRGGLLMSYYSTDGKYAPFALGVTAGALANGGTSINIGAAAATELVRANGSSGNLVLTGSNVASGTCRQLTVAYSGVNTSTGAVTITAAGTSAVWTLTAAAGTDGGMYRLRVTTPNGVSATTTALAWNANSATVDAALEALSNVGASGVVAVYDGGAETLTLTFAANLGAVQVQTVNDTTNDGGVDEGGWTVVNTTVGIDSRFIAGSWVSQPNYATPLTFIGDGYPVPVPTDGTDAAWPFVPTQGNINVAKLIHYPSDSSMKTWLKAQMSTTAGNKFIFSDSN